jgi:hypothetical protein
MRLCAGEGAALSHSSSKHLLELILGGALHKNTPFSLMFVQDSDLHKKWSLALGGAYTFRALVLAGIMTIGKED